MVNIITDKPKPIDFSIIPSTKCNLNCEHCMYDAGSEAWEELIFTKAMNHINTIDWDMVNSCWFCGGEPSIDLSTYAKFIIELPDVKKTIITNGTWSTSLDKTKDFIDFCAKYDLNAIIKSNEHIKQHQNLETIEKVKTISFIYVKEYNLTNPMGRAYKPNWVCDERCQDNRLSFTILPNGDIVYSNCSGHFPLVQTVEQPFSDLLKNCEEQVKKCREMMVSRKSGKEVLDIYLPKTMKIVKPTEETIKYGSTFKWSDINNWTNTVTIGADAGYSGTARVVYHQDANGYYYATFE